MADNISTGILSGLYEKVIHKKFGEGKVQSIADKHIYVKFADGQKNFAFPNAFTDGFLHLPK